MRDSRRRKFATYHPHKQWIQPTLWYPPSDPQGWSPLCELIVFLSSHSVVGTPARDRLSRSHSHAPGLVDQICQILRLELRRGRDRHSRSSSQSRSRSSSGESSDSESSHRSGCSQTCVRHWCFSRSSRSSSRSHRLDRSCHSPHRHGRHFHSCRRSDCSRSRSPLLSLPS